MRPISSIFPQGDQPMLWDNSKSASKSDSDNTYQFCVIAGERTSPDTFISFLSWAGL